MRYFLGIDPGLGVRSATGISIIDMDTYDIICDREIWSEKKRQPINQKLIYLSNQFKQIVSEYQTWESSDMAVCIESFVMRGKSGQSLQRLIGSFLASTDHNNEILEVQNTKVKLAISGTGSGDKEQVGLGLIKWFSNKNKESEMIIKDLLLLEKWDILDSIAIAISGYLYYNKD